MASAAKKFNSLDWCARGVFANFSSFARTSNAVSGMLEYSMNRSMEEM
jgi:hypothetical protein